MQSNRIDFANLDRINIEIQRRALVIAQATLETRSAEDPYTVASRQVFHELLARLAEEQKTA